MRAHVLDADGTILNTIMVSELVDGLVDADLTGGSVGDRIVDMKAVTAELPIVSDQDYNATIIAQLELIDAKSIRPLREGDTVRVVALEQQAAALRILLRKV